jgi:hypothetical protein
MILRHIRQIFLFLLFFFVCFTGKLYAQKIDLNKVLAPVFLEIKNRNPILLQSTLTVDKFDIDLKKESIKLTLNKNFGNIPYREDDIVAFYDSIRAALPNPLNTYGLQIYITSYPIEDLVPNFFRNKKATDQSRIPPKLPNAQSIVTNESKPYKITDGLNNKHLAIWHSHGWYYDPIADLWQWQRPRLFQTVEDLFTMGYTIPYLIPMLENAGAYVFVPRERDTQLNEVIVDNDDKNTSEYVEHNGKEEWKAGNGYGFSNLKEIYSEYENPFLYGSYRQIKSRRNGDSYTEWLPNIPEKGNYAVYISYKTLPESAEEAYYTVYHSGGKTEFKVNQTMGGSTWILLGFFDFEEGLNPQTGKVQLSNRSKDNNKIITADAVRFGGGISNIARTKNLQKRSKQVAEPKTSGQARYLEGARYWLQWAGYSDSIYNLNNNKNDYKDDYMSRGEWVNNLIGGSVKLPKKKGKNIPLDMVLGFHSDAGVVMNDSIIGTMSIYMTESNNGLYANGQRRISSRDLADLVQTEVVNDVRSYFREDWTRRKLVDQSYNEARVPEVPTLLLELLSHQNYTDMRYGLDPNFRFTVARAVYKGILKFISTQYGTDYVVQPLPVSHVSAEFLNSQQQEVFLSWREKVDTLEPTAHPEKYIVYTSIDEGGFDNGIITDEPHITIPIEWGKIYNFKVAAINKGGESFPSEILSVCKVPESTKTVLIINGFHRVAAPASFDNELTAGFLDNIDQGVPDRYDISYTGSQYEFKKSILFKTNQNPGYGASEEIFENDVIAGNTFNFPYIHGKAIKEAGYSFVSCSDDAVMSGNLNIKPFFAVDLILGEEKETQTGKISKYKLFTAPMRDVLTEYLDEGGNLFVSGAYIGSDIWERENCDPAEIEFAENRLHYKWKESRASLTGKVSNFLNPFPEFTNSYSFCTSLNRSQYAVEAPDAIEPVNGAFTILTYEDNNYPACVSYDGNYRTVTAAFPFESLLTDNQRNLFMKEIMNFFQ